MNFNVLHGKIFRAQKRQEMGKTREVVPTDRSYLKAAVFDIECMNFVAGGLGNFMICASVLPLDADAPYTHAITFKDDNDDKRVLAKFVQDLLGYDILIGHNIAAFDFNWLYSRIMYHRLPSPSKRWLYYDTYQAARRLAIKAERKSLGFLGDYFSLEGVKTAVLPVSWQRVYSRKKTEFESGLEDIVYHCEQDVILNRNLFDVLWPRDRAATNLPFTKKW